MERSLSILGGFWRLAVVNIPRACACKNGATSMYTTARQFLWDLIDEVVITSSRSKSKTEKERERGREREGGREGGRETERKGLGRVLFYRGVMEISTDVMPPLRLSLRHCNVSPSLAFLRFSPSWSLTVELPGKRSLRA